MKKLMIVALFSMIGANTSVLAQSAFRFNVGYSLPLGAQLLASDNSSSSSPTGYSSTSKAVFGTWGSGWNFGASYVHMFSKYAGVDVGASYFQGSSYSNSSKYSYSDPTVSMSEVTTATGRISGFLFTSNLILQPALEKTFQPYAKIGLVLGSVQFREEYSDVMTNSPPLTTNKTNRTREYSGGLPFGLRGGIGMVFNAGKKINFFSEILITSLAYRPAKSVVTSFSVNEVDRMGTLTENNKTTIYKDEVTATSVPPNTSQPSESLGGSFPMGNVMINIGLQFRLGAAQ